MSAQATKDKILKALYILKESGEEFRLSEEARKINTTSKRFGYFAREYGAVPTRLSHGHPAGQNYACYQFEKKGACHVVE